MEVNKKVIKNIITYLLLIAIVEFIGIGKVGATPANPAFTDDNFYKCVINGYNTRYNSYTSRPNYCSDYSYHKNVNYTYKLSNKQLSCIGDVVCSAKKGWDDYTVSNVSNITGIKKLSNLSYLSLIGQNLTSFNVSGLSNLKHLYIDGNKKMTSINLTTNTKLTYLSIYSCKLNSLDLSKNTKLSEFYLGDNGLTSIEVPNKTIIGNTPVLYPQLRTDVVLTRNSNGTFSLDLKKLNSKLKPGSVSLNGAYKEGTLSNSELTYIGNYTSDVKASYNKSTGVITFNSFPGAVRYYYSSGKYKMLVALKTKNQITNTLSVGGTGITTKTVSCRGTVAGGCNVVIPTVSRSGYELYGYSTTANSKTVTYKSGTAINIKNNTKIYAITRKKVSVSYPVTNTGIAISKKSDTCYIYNGDSSCMVISPTITRSGYEILGFSKTQNAKENDYLVNSTIGINANTTLYPVTRKKINVSYVTNNQDLIISKDSDSCYIYNGETACNVFLPTISGDGYNILGFSKNDTNQGIVSNSTLTLTQDATYYARAVKPSNPVIEDTKVYVATFIYNGLTDVLSCETSDDSCIVKAPSKIVSNGTFEGWSETEGGSVKYNSDAEIALSSNKTFYGISHSNGDSSNSKTYTATFVYNGLVAMHSCTTTGDSCEVIAPSYDADNGVFEGWTTKVGEDVKYPVGSNITLNDNVTLYGVLKVNKTPVEGAKLYTLTFMNDTVLGTLSCETTNASCYVDTPKMQMGNDSIEGWSESDENKEIKYQPGEKVELTANKTLYAVTTNSGGPENTNVYTLSLFNDGLSGMLSCESENGLDSCLIEAPSLDVDNGTFEGWSDQENGEVKYKKDDEIVLNENKSLYAIIKKDQSAKDDEEEKEESVLETFVATFKYNDEELKVECKTYTGLCDITAIQQEGVDGVFAGWTISKDGAVKYKPGDIITLDSNLILYGKTEKDLSANGDIVNVPDTGSFISIAGTILGTALVSGGGYAAYRKYKNI